MAYYKVINKVRYAADLLQLADKLLVLTAEQKLNLESAEQLYKLAMDGGKVTDIELRTLGYILDHYALEAAAAAWLGGQLNAGSSVLEQTIIRVLRSEYNLKQIKWQIDPSAVKLQEQLDKNRLFGSALKGAVEAFLHWSQGSLSFAGCVGRRDLAYTDQNTSTDLLKSYFDKGTLHLIPGDLAGQTALGFELPAGLDFENFWIFGFQTPDFEHVQFIALVHRRQNFQHSKGYFSKKAPIDALSTAIIKQYSGFHDLKWSFDQEEINKQLALVPDQNFGNALFAGVYNGIFNAESSFSFHDFITQEVWVDPELDAQHYMKAYVQAGTLYLIPLDYSAQTAAGTADFPIPENVSISIESEWVFGLSMPSKTNFKLLLTIPRENNDGEMAWNSCFIDDQRPVSEIIQRVIYDEFQLETLEWSLPEEDAIAQQQQFGPDWRHLPGLFRQALNTILHDYKTPKSVFNFVAKLLEEETPFTDFDEPQAYRAIIREHVHQFLKTASLEFLPIELTDNNPIQGELVQDNWLFYTLLPDMHPVGFWVVIPRWPDDVQQAYVYGDF